MLAWLYRKLKVARRKPYTYDVAKAHQKKVRPAIRVFKRVTTVRTLRLTKIYAQSMAAAEYKTLRIDFVFST